MVNYNRRWQDAIDQGDALWLAVSCQGDFFEFYIVPKHRKAEWQL